MQPSARASNDAPRLIASVGPTKKTRTQITQSRRNRIWLLRASGLFAAGRRRVSRQQARSDGGARLSEVPSIRVGRSRHVPSARATSSTGRQGMLIPMTPARRSGLLRSAARPWRAVWTAGQRQRSGCSGTGALTRSPGAGGSNHRARLAPPGNVTGSGRGRRWRARAASRVIQHAVPPSQGGRAGSIHERGHAARSG